MRIQCWTTLGLFLLTITGSSFSFAQPTKLPVIVDLYDQQDYQGQISVRWSADEATSFELKGTDRWLSSPQIHLPTDLREVRIEGSLSWKHYQSGPQRSSGSRVYPVIDFGPAVGELRSQRSWGQRMARFVHALSQLEKQHQHDDSPSEWIEPSGAIPQTAINSAQQRMKLKLPEEHIQLLKEYGAWSYADSLIGIAIDDLDRADKQMKSIWGSPTSEFATLSAKTKTLYQGSMMLFVEAGDGYGSLIYHPTNSGGEFYWIHQDNLDEPEKLVDGQGKSRDYSSSLRWLIANQILCQYDDVFPEHTFIDRSAPTAIRYVLRIDFPSPKRLESRLEVDWRKFE